MLPRSRAWSRPALLLLLGLALVLGPLAPVADAAPVTAVTNPMPARGGTDPESIEHVRQIAPSAFRTPRRAVTAADYATVAGRHPEVQQATATERWTGFGRPSTSPTG